MKPFLLTILLLAVIESRSAMLFIKGDHIASDSIEVFITLDEATGSREKKTLIRSGTDFLLHTQYDQLCWISLKEGNNLVVGWLAPADSVTLYFHSGNITGTFRATGRGACNYFPRLAWPTGSQLLKKYRDVGSNNIAAILQSVDSLYRHYRDSLQAVLCADIPSHNVWLGMLATDFNWLGRRLLGKAYPDQALSILRHNDQVPAAVRQRAKQLLMFDQAYYVSPSYINDVYYTLLQEYMLLKLNYQADGTTGNKYRFYLDHLPPGPLRERVLCILLETDFKAAADTDVLNSIIEKCYPAGQTDVYTLFARHLPQLYNRQFRKGQPAPDFVLTDTAGHTIQLADLRGKVLILDFWYEACVPCHSLFEAMKPLKRKYAGRPDVLFINISIDKTAVWQAALRKRAIDGLHLYTGNQGGNHPVLTAYGVESYPSVFIIDQQGRFHSAAPPVGNMKAFEGEIEALIGE